MQSQSRLKGRRRRQAQRRVGPADAKARGAHCKDTFLFSCVLKVEVNLGRETLVVEEHSMGFHGVGGPLISELDAARSHLLQPQPA